MKKTQLATLLFFLGLQVNAQNYLGVMTSNYGGVMSTDLQPASFVDGRFLFDLNLGSVNVNAYQNFVSFNTSGMPGGWLKSFKNDEAYNSWALPDSTFMDRHIVKRYTDNSNDKMGVNINLQMDLFNFAFHINSKIAIGLKAKVRSITNIGNVDPSFAILIEQGFDYPSLWNQKIEEQFLNVNHLTWAEVGFNYGQVVLDKKEHFLKLGGTIKYLKGYSAAYFQTSNLQFNLKNNDTTQLITGNFNYGYSDNLPGLIENGLDNKFNSNFGVGLDLGFVYEWRPKYKDFKYDMDGETNLWMKNKNKYKAKVGISLIDLGSMRFKKGGLSRNFSVNNSSPFDLQSFSTTSSLSDFDQIIDSLILESSGAGNTNWTSEQSPNSTFVMRTPTALSLQLDYQLGKYFYVNVSGVMNVILKKKDTKVIVPNQFSITPSFDWSWFGLFLPISMNEYSGFKTGLASRLGPLSIGVTDFRALFSVGKVRGTEFYLGLRLPILYSAIKDKDKDKVSDLKDNCISTPGIWAFKGCPDTDGDGLMDKEDECPEIAGLVEFKGCPDSDGDKIIDKLDDCPEIAGLAEFKGCPDSDGDKIIDKLDDCPEVAGLAEFKGCPDSDSDGIKDSDDACPQNAGPKENQGCPDKDSDGLFDFIDACPEIAGPKENNGCPWPDTDGDGILDKDDACPLLKGPAANKGCPYKDTDGDGLLDKDDDCPNTAGPIENKGCPIIEVEIVEVLRTAFDNLEFESGKDIILEVSKVALDELADVLIKKATWKLEISGHTDNIGGENFNLVLSKKRAEALKNYLIFKGVDTNRLITFYFGETQPLIDNTTLEGRKKNRRVEMKITFD
jgi:outer membrane protein OmpA-like peptidoglycan-associated protein